jgi:acetyl/propionyl-CoA carboxylase alpha subunit
MRIEGVTTAVSFHRKVMEHPAFRAGDLHTGFLGDHPELVAPGEDPWLTEITVIAAAVAHFRRLETTAAAPAQADAATTRSAWRWQGRGGWRV